MAVLLLCGCLSYAAEILVIRTPDAADEAEQIKGIAEFYGLGIHAVDASSVQSVAQALTRLADRHTVAVLVAQDALPALRRDAVVNALRRPNKAIPLMIFDIHGNSEPLNSWSDGAVRGCGTSSPAPAGAVLVIDKDAAIARNLAGWRLPAVSAPACDLQPAEGRAQNLIVAQAGAWRSSILVRTQSRPGEVYYAARMVRSGEPIKVAPLALPEVFSSAATYFLFFRHAAGDYAWHYDAQYANLTIDDPWLTEPYGHLAYGALLTEMQKHRFHTTIAFIPWNFDRSEPDVVTLFREHPEHYSIAVHGDDHTHQ